MADKEDRDDGGVAEVSDAQLQEEVAARLAEVNRLLTKKDKLNALRLCLSNPPVGAKAVEIKVFVILAANLNYMS